MIDELTNMMVVGTGWVAILMPVLLIWIIFYYATKNDKEKYKAMIEVAKNLDEAADVEALLESFQEKKKPIDYRRTGVITMFVGLGLFFFGLVNIKILIGVGLLVICIGFGSIVAGYIYPNESEEINKAVEEFEKKQALILGKHHKKLFNSLEELRKKFGLTQQELSESAEVSRKSINAIENGIYVPSTVLALKIAETLNCKVEDLFQLPKN